MSQESDNRDKLRMCPTCRMEISIFATKCRFCGEPVGRPRDEARKLTIDDLGGASVGDYTPSEEVVDALESFRREELERRLAAEHEEPDSWGLFGRRKKDKPHAPAEPRTFDQLDASSRDLANIGGLSRTFERKRARRQPVWTKKLALGAASVAVIIVLIFGATFVKASIDDYRARRNAKPEVVVDNRAIAIAESGDYMGALREAVRAAREYNAPEQQEVAERVRQKVAEHIREMLNSDNWSDTLMRQVEEEINQAVSIDSGKTLMDVKAEVREEVRVYSLTFSDADPDAGTVMFRLLDENKPTDLARISERVNGRLEIMNITRDHVRLKDHERKTSKGIPRQISLDRYGSFNSA